MGKCLFLEPGEAGGHGGLLPHCLDSNGSSILWRRGVLPAPLRLSELPSPGICQRDKHLEHQQILLHEAPCQCSLGFLLGHHGDLEGQAVWRQAGVNQVDVLGGTELPAMIRESLLSHS